TGYACHIPPISYRKVAQTYLTLHIFRNCFEEGAQKDVEPHIEMKLYKEGKLIDPTYHLQNCKLIYSLNWRYNGVRGWDIECRMMEDEDGGEKRAPLIYSPIAGELVGRTRLVFDQNGAYSGCDNDGMFIVGTGDWIGPQIYFLAHGQFLKLPDFASGFEARLYNVKTREDLGFGRNRIVQGEPIGTRLECDSSPDSVFLEVSSVFTSIFGCL
ncbi:hypothetical protein ANCDUO_14646, partial [Ancylostoma duodenale]